VRLSRISSFPAVVHLLGRWAQLWGGFRFLPAWRTMMFWFPSFSHDLMMIYNIPLGWRSESRELRQCAGNIHNQVCMTDDGPMIVDEVIGSVRLPLWGIVPSTSSCHQHHTKRLYLGAQIIGVKYPLQIVINTNNSFERFELWWYYQPPRALQNRILWTGINVAAQIHAREMTVITQAAVWR